MHRKNAFTLSEILITIGIIGIVSALTLPTLMTKIRKRTVETQLKKTYAMLANAVKHAENEYGVGFDMLEGVNHYSSEQSAQVFDKYLTPHLRINYKYSLEDCEKLVTVYVQNNDTPFKSTTPACYSLSNGVSIAYFVGKQSNIYFNSLSIYLNPNFQHKIAGRDSFSFDIVSGDNGLYIGNDAYKKSTRAKLIQDCGKNESRFENPLGIQISPASPCSELIRRDGWKINPDYPVKF
ncbi:prepilin-type N-terminal cleavage/methylation domain-containing protein [bacterium]|nr:prepilin-type N-terminal cleavage/methylation domain-containing protein [bacterium]